MKPDKTSTKLTDKDTIIGLVFERLKEDSLLDLTAFIGEICPPTHTHSAFVRDVAFRIRKKGRIEIIEKENGGRFLIYEVPQKGWAERFPLIHDVILAIIAASLSLGGGWILVSFSDKAQDQRDLRQETNIQMLTDSLKNLDLEVRKLNDSIERLSKGQNLPLNKTKSITSLPAIPLFINQTVSQIRKYWETRISNEYFDEGTYAGSSERYFSIMVGSIGTPEFSASFDNKGYCKSHATKIDYSEISIMQARLKNAGYVYNKKCKCWTLDGQNHSWSINESFGQNFELECTRR